MRLTTTNGNLFKTKSRESWGIGRGGWDGRRFGGGGRRLRWGWERVGGGGGVGTNQTLAGRKNGRRDVPTRGIELIDRGRTLKA